MLPPSPCIGICRIDETSGLCIGCARSAEEIAAWRTAEPDLVQRIWAELPARRRQLGIGLHRLGWTKEEIGRFVVATLQNRAGTWVCGIYGAVAEFCIGDGEACTFQFDEDALVARTDRGAIGFGITEQVRALAIGGDADFGKAAVIALAVPRAQARLPAHSGLKGLGADLDAVRPDSHDHRLYDFGLGTPVSQFCIRVDGEPLAAQLDELVDQPWPVFLKKAGGAILQASPARVVTSPIGRIEVFTPIPPPSGASPAGPHTHFLPAYLATGHEAPPSLGIPDVYAVCALFYPAGDAMDLLGTAFRARSRHATRVHS